MSAASSRKWSLENRKLGLCYSCGAKCKTFRCGTCRDRINAQKRDNGGYYKPATERE